MLEEFEACTMAGDMLRQAGFEFRHCSLKSEAVYYGWPGRIAVIRVACHRAERSELNSVPSVAIITFNGKNFKNGRIPQTHIVRLVTGAIGHYMLVTSGVIRARARYRKYWPDGGAELDQLTALDE